MNFFKNNKIKFGILIIFLVFIIFNLANSKPIDFKFTNEEMNFLKSNKNFVLAPDPSYAPIEFFDSNGEFKGLVSEYVRWINENTDLTIKIKRYKNWNKVIEAIKNKEVDLLGGVVKTKKRKEFITFTDDYIEIPIMIVSNGNKKIENLNKFENIEVAVVKNSGNHDLMKSNYPLAKLKLFDNIENALKATSIGEVDTLVASYSQISYYTKKNKISNLKIIRELDYTYNLNFGVRKDYELLSSIMNKIINKIPENTEEDFLEKWIYLEKNNSLIDNKEFQQLLIVFILIVVVLIIGARLLKMQVNSRTKEVQLLNEELKDELRTKDEMINEIITSLVNLIELHDSYTKGHSKNVAELSKKIALEYKMNDKKINEVYIAALLHDLGKALIPLEIINKKGRLSVNEYEQIKRHPELGYGILKDMKKFKNIARYVLHHHERYDGNGYPQGLKEDDIPLISRIISVADSYDTMTTDRPYRKKISPKEAIDDILKNSGSQFDPEIVKIFDKIMNQ